MKIRTKLGATYLILSLLLLTFVSGFYYQYAKTALTHEILEHLRSVASIQQHRIEGIVDQNLERIRLVSSRTQLRISINKYQQTLNKSHLDTIKPIIHDALKSINSFEVISILDQTGKVIVSTSKKHLGVNYHDESFFKASQNENTANHFFLNSDKELKLYLAGPLLFDNKHIGMLVIESDVNNINASLNDYSGLGKTGETVLARANLETNNVDFLAPLRFDKKAPLQRKLSLNNTNAPIVKALQNKPQVYTETIDYRHQNVLAATRYIEKTSWGLVVKIDRDEAFAPIKHFGTYFFIIILSALIILGLVSYVLTYVITKPLLNLTNAVKKIDSGDFSFRAEVNGTNEIAMLANAFNNMTDNLLATQSSLEKSNKELQKHRDHLEELVFKRTQELELINNELESFSYSVSHDLRSPLRSIEGFARIIQEEHIENLSKEGIQYFDRISAAAERMGLLIDSILKLSKINRGNIAKANFNLLDLVEYSITQLDPKPNPEHSKFTVTENLMVFADHSLMQIVIQNLLSNAWKYSGKNNYIEIEISLEQKNNESVFYIKDNGVGFDMKYYNRLFGPFQRLVGVNEFPGTGIGLATVARVIHRHGGRIWAESELGKGATFYFSLPDEAKSTKIRTS